MGRQPYLWFENFYRSRGIPTLVWALAAFLPFIILYVAAIFLAGLTIDVYAIILPPLPFYVIVNLYTQYASRYASGRIVKLADQWHLVDKHSISLEPLFGLRGPTISSLVVYAVFLPLFDATLLTQYSLFQVILIGILPWLYYAYFFGTLFWVLTYSAYTINKMGKLPLELKHFTEDRTLGLRDFGSVSLRLAGLYVVFVALFAIPNTIQGYVNLDFLLLYIGLFLVAIPLFLLPLLGLHRKLVSEKGKVIARFTPSYKRMIQELEANGTGVADEKFVDQLITSRQVLQEASQIHEWPFDTGIIVRLSAIVLSVIAILLSRILTLILRI